MEMLRLSLPILAVLAESEPWLLQHPRSETHPLVLAFYVPAHLRDVVTQLAHQAPGQDQEVHRPAVRLMP